MIRGTRLLAFAALLLATPAVAFGPNGEAFWIAGGYPDQKRLGHGDYEDGAARVLALTAFNADGTVTAF